MGFKSGLWLRRSVPGRLLRVALVLEGESWSWFQVSTPELVFFSVLGSVHSSSLPVARCCHHMDNIS